MYAINKMTLYVTRYCNLDCEYCFVDRKREHLGWVTGKRGFDWLIHEVSGECKDLSVGFFGGEPLVVYDLIVRLLEYGTAESSRVGKGISYLMPTNGILLTEERTQCLAQFPLSLNVSIDGDALTHDLLRKNKDGSGTSEQLEKNIKHILLYIPDSGARVTVNPQTVPRLAVSIDHVLALGFKNITIGLNSDVSWSIGDLTTLDKELRKVANRYLKRMIEGRPFVFSMFDDSLKNLISGTRPSAVCGAGKGLVNIGIKGDIYPCHRFTCLQNFEGAYRLGDLSNGIDEQARTPFLRYDAEKSLGCYTSCDKCQAKPICGGGCFAKAYNSTGLFQMSDPLGQKFKLIAFDVVKDIFDVLSEYEPPLFRDWQHEFQPSNLKQSSVK